LRRLHGAENAAAPSPDLPLRLFPPFRDGRVVVGGRRG